MNDFDRGKETESVVDDWQKNFLLVLAELEALTRLSSYSGSDMRLSLERVQDLVTTMLLQEKVLMDRAHFSSLLHLADHEYFKGMMYFFLKGSSEHVTCDLIAKLLQKLRDHREYHDACLISLVSTRQTEHV